MENNTGRGSVTFSSSHEKEIWRMERLIAVYSCVHEGHRWLISSMDDHKGELTVTIKRPSEDLEDSIVKLWHIQNEVHVKVISE
tara:strand:- start:800 stop:1051 length:252 start_codon:yes stop_codon:yes gene_type:complete